MPKTELKHLIYLVRIIGSNEILLSLLLAVGLVMVLPPYLLLAYPSEEVIKAFEYTRYAPLLFLFLLSVIFIRGLKYLLKLLIKYFTDKYRDHRYERQRKNYLINLNNYALGPIAWLYNSDEYTNNLSSNEQSTIDLIDWNIIEYIRDYDEETGTYSLTDWAIDIINRNNKLHDKVDKLIHKS